MAARRTQSAGQGQGQPLPLPAWPSIDDAAASTPSPSPPARHGGPDAAAGPAATARCRCAGARSRAPTALGDAFWRHTMPRLARESAAVRQASAAARALLLATGAPRPGDEAVRRFMYGRALARYGHALREARRAAGLRDAVLCSLFFAIFESVNGDAAAADAHLHSGQRVLDELGGACACTCEAAGPPPLRAMLRHAVQFLTAPPCGREPSS